MNDACGVEGGVDASSIAYARNCLQFIGKKGYIIKLGKT